MTTSMTRRLGGALVALALGLILPASASAATFVVTNLNDSGVGSLRQAILDANGNGAADTITFARRLAGRTIALSSGQLGIANDTAGPDLTIDGDADGDGAPDITVDAQGGSRVFLIASGAEATLEGLVITGGAFSGGGILNDGGTLTVTNSTIRGNSGDFGGGINNRGTAAVEGSTISGNTAGFDGGGIHHDAGTLTVIRSTISGNSARFGGGAIENNTRGTLTVVNSTITRNVAVGGSGIQNFGAVSVEASTISGNNNSSNLAGGGIRHETGDGTVEIKSTIVAGNSPGDCFFGTITSLGFNLEGGTSCGFTATGDQQNIAVAAVLVTDASGAPVLADNGGPTRTIALLDADTNPALDAIPVEDCTDVDDMPVLFDQRGISRPQPADGNCDIGAFELVQAAPVTIADVIELFDAAVAGDTLIGAGPGKSAPGRLNALRNMLLAAGDLLEQGEVDAACGQLQDVADRTDGTFPPPDFAQGDAASDLLDAIT
ncbi:MAG: choice-of-anchor Q domain-containing protein, partial [Geminicoccaceae bacterium]